MALGYSKVLEDVIDLCFLAFVRERERVEIFRFESCNVSFQNSNYEANTLLYAAQY